jgi:DNA-directed RNA polymerase subunit H (RpoH/RPB5)
MEQDKALEMIRTMVGRRGLDTRTERVTTEDIERVTLYTVGGILVIFSQKEKGLLERDIRLFVEFASNHDYSNGLIIVSLMPPSENVLKAVKQLTKDNPIQFFHIQQLKFDITTHRMAMPHRILKDNEKEALFKQYNIVNPHDQLPWIDSQDAMVKWIGGRPTDIIEVTRHSDVAGRQLYYRYCVPDVNVA